MPPLRWDGSGEKEADPRALRNLAQSDDQKSHRQQPERDGGLRGDATMTDVIFDKIKKVDNPQHLQEKERKSLIAKIEDLVGCDVAVLYHNLASANAMLDDSDAEMLEGVLSAHASERALLLIVNSNGGLPLAAERLVHVARTYCPRGFRTMVVQKAKSAATMVCLGSDQIYMTTTAELGPIDPQIIGFDKSRRISVDSYLAAYEKLMAEIKMIDMNKKNPAGLLHQLNRFDAAHVEEMKKARELGRDMTRNFLNKYMLKGKGKSKVEGVIKVFSKSAQHKSHGRPIWATEAKAQGLKINVLEHTSDLWKAAYELVQRYDHLCALRRMMNGEEFVKTLETRTTTHRFCVPIEEDN